MAFPVPGNGYGKWQNKRLPMGLSIAEAAFQRLVDKVFGDLEPHCYAYLDNIQLVSKDFDEHVRLLTKLITRIENAGLKINREKSDFCKQKVKYLGFIINEHGMTVDPEKTDAVKNYFQDLFGLFCILMVVKIMCDNNCILQNSEIIIIRIVDFCSYVENNVRIVLAGQYAVMNGLCRRSDVSRTDGAQASN